MKRILVTGGSGFLGRNIIRELLDRYPDAEIISVSRSEGSISQLLTTCPSSRLKIVMADVRDMQALRWAMRRVDTAVHLAAMKRVELSEEQSREVATINVIGTMNMLDTFSGDTFVLFSTDKAVEPVNCYGATKMVSERLVLEQARKEENQSRFMVVRCCNVVGSTGSVLDIWRHQIALNNEITVTDLDMKRYYTSIGEVVQLCMAVLERGENGKIYLTPKGNATTLREMVEQAIKMYGNEDTKIRLIGLRPGEKMQEKLLGIEEKNVVADFCKAEVPAQSVIRVSN